MQYKIWKMFFVFDIIASELVVVNDPYDYRNKFTWISTC